MFLSRRTIRRPRRTFVPSNPSGASPQTITAGASTASWVVGTVALVAVVTLSPAAVSASWAVPAPTLSTPVTLSPSAVTADWAVPDPTLTTRVTLAPSVVTADWSVPSPTLSTPASLDVDAATASWSVPSASLDGSQMLAAGSSVATWAVPTPGLVVIAPIPPVAPGGGGRFVPHYQPSIRPEEIEAEVVFILRRPRVTGEAITGPVALDMAALLALPPVTMDADALVGANPVDATADLVIGEVQFLVAATAQPFQKQKRASRREEDH